MLAGLQMPDKNHDPVVLGFVHVHAIPSGNVLVFKVTIRPSGLGWHRNVVANHPSGCVVAFRREAGDTRFRERLTDPAVDDKGVAIVPRIASPKFNKILPPTTSCGRLGARYPDLIRRNRFPPE